MINPHIKCKVNRCKYNDEKQHCSLDTICVGNSCDIPHDKCDTECDSFEERSGA